MKKNASEVHVWRDETTARDRATNEYYSVSVVDACGDEITCVGGSKKLSRAWDIGVSHAADIGVPCVEYASAAGAQGRETDRWEP